MGADILRPTAFCEQYLDGGDTRNGRSFGRRYNLGFFDPSFATVGSYRGPRTSFFMGFNWLLGDALLFHLDFWGVD